MAGTLVKSPGFLKNAERTLLQLAEAFEHHDGVQFRKLVDIDMQVHRR